MSMLSSQIKELREKADMLDGLEGMNNLVPMLREAADTIESLRERAQAALALEALVRDMYLTWKRLDESHEWPDPEDGIHNGHNGWKTFTRRMRGLGITGSEES